MFHISTTLGVCSHFVETNSWGVHTHFVAAGDPNERFPPVWPKFMCEQLQLFTEIKYSAGRKLWNLQTLKVPATKLLSCAIYLPHCVAPSIEISIDSNA